MKNPVVIAALFVVSLALVGWSKVSQSPKVRWEYKMVSAVLSPLPIQWYEDGQKTDAIKMLPKATQLGGEGWEMVSFDIGSDTIVYWFKRPKP